MIREGGTPEKASFNKGGAAMVPYRLNEGDELGGENQSAEKR